MIPFNELKRGFELYQVEYEAKALEVMRSGWYILGSEVSSFEKEFSEKLGGGYCAGVDNGMNAIKIGLRALGIGEGDEVIVQSNAYIATVIAISVNAAVPVFVEPDNYFNIDASKIEAAITSKTKAVLVTHLYGQPSKMDTIAEICEENNLFLLEDCAQSHFSTYKGKCTGLIGHMGFFSFFPTKNLGCFGDGGAIVSGEQELIEKVKMLRNYGSKTKYYNEEIGYNSRLDELQAGLLRIKLSHIDELQAERDKIANRYLTAIKNPHVTLPEVLDGAKPVWHLFVVRVKDRDVFREYLIDNGVSSEIHYPVPVHLSQAYAKLGYKRGDFPIAEEYADTVVSLPIMYDMADAEIQKVIDVVNSYGR